MRFLINGVEVVLSRISSDEGDPEGVLKLEIKREESRVDFRTAQQLTHGIVDALSGKYRDVSSTIDAQEKVYEVQVLEGFAALRSGLIRGLFATLLALTGGTAAMAWFLMTERLLP